MYMLYILCFAIVTLINLCLFLSISDSTGFISQNLHGKDGT